MPCQLSSQEYKVLGLKAYVVLISMYQLPTRPAVTNTTCGYQYHLRLPITAVTNTTDMKLCVSVIKSSTWREKRQTWRKLWHLSLARPLLWRCKHLTPLMMWNQKFKTRRVIGGKSSNSFWEACLSVKTFCGNTVNWWPVLLE